MELRQTFISGIGPENSLFAQKPLEASNGFRTVRRNGSSSWEGLNQKQVSKLTIRFNLLSSV
jgi:hypothetical protein